VKNYFIRAKKQLKAATKRALQASVCAFVGAFVGTSAFNDIDWAVIGSIVAVAAVSAFLYGITAPLPECKEE